MSYSEPLLNQLRVFFLSLGFGFAVGVFYTFMRSLFSVFGENKAAVLLCDLLFGVSSSVAAFFFMVIYNNGRVRLHLAFGIILSAAVFYFSLGRYIYRAFYSIIGIFRKKFIKKVKKFKNNYRKYLKK